MSIKKVVAGSAGSVILLMASFFGFVGDSVRISEDGLANLIQNEGYSKTTYKDQAGVPTVGVGSTIGVIMGKLYTEGELAERLAKDVLDAERCLNRNVTVDLNQGEWDAYTSFVFNVGCSAFVSSSTYRILEGKQRGTRIQACNAMSLWNKITVKGRKVFNQGIQNRRDRDIALCVKQL